MNERVFFYERTMKPPELGEGHFTLHRKIQGSRATLVNIHVLYVYMYTLYSDNKAAVQM